MDDSRAAGFRFSINQHELACVFGHGKSESNLSKENTHWIIVDNIKLEENIRYFTIVINYENGKIRFFQNGKNKAETTCSLNYINNDEVFDSHIPFTVGLWASGAPITISYTNFSLYSCRLYNRILSEDEISKNYIATTKYHNDLVHK